MGCGALQPIETAVETVKSAAGLEFVLRVVQNVDRKHNAGERRRRDPTVSAGANAKRFNPFLPYEQAMYVQHVGLRHVLLLNKFPVVDAHVLLVTTEYEAQNSLLTADDFRALCEVLREMDGLAFYNAGTIAGASQHHKHLQIVGGELAPNLRRGQSPLDEMVMRCEKVNGDEPFGMASLPFAHLAIGVGDAMSDERRAGEICMARYTQLLDELSRQVDGLAAPFAYNLVVNRRWMMVVPRREECYQGVSVNSLGFVGCLLVRDAQQLELIKSKGPMTVLEHTGFERERRDN